MFTGIIQELGTVVSTATRRGICRLEIDAPKTARGLMPGESVAVNGACLSALDVRRGRLVFEMIPETQRLTALGALTRGVAVNLERSLTLSDRLNGHLVLGHVDGVGTIARCAEAPGQRILEIRIEPRLARYLVPKGPVTIDGVSLTVGALPSRGRLSVYLIPDTLRKTTLGRCRAGDRVNVEIDYVAKLIVQRHGGAAAAQTRQLRSGRRRIIV